MCGDVGERRGDGSSLTAEKGPSQDRAGRGGLPAALLQFAHYVDGKPRPRWVYGLLA